MSGGPPPTALRPAERLLVAIRAGLIAGAVVLFIGLLGMLEKFADRAIVEGLIGVSAVIVATVLLLAGQAAAARTVPPDGPLARRLGFALAAGLGVGLTAALLIGLFLRFGQAVNLRPMFINASPALYALLGAALPGMVAAGVLGALLRLLGETARRALLVGATAVVLMGLLGDQFLLILSHNRVPAARVAAFLAPKGITPLAAGLVFVAALVLDLAWRRRGPAARARLAARPQRERWMLNQVLLGIALLALLILPQILGPYHSEVLNQVGLFALMGLGLNIVVGFAGMLDLGYVAFFAIGAYSVAILTSPESFLAAGGEGVMGFWGALPFAILFAVLAGILLGIPVLPLRGDYLAIVTLGFGEIIRLLALSEWLAPYLGGAQGIAGIPPIEILGWSVSGPAKPQKLFYIVLVGCIVAAFVAQRLKDARLGRAWMAVREDEDVAEAMGIHLVRTKLLAFAIGAAFSGVSGAIFATKLGSIYPHSFSLLISINILAIIIVGGMGSIAGVVLGALVLVGLPELLREFAEFRWLVYGALLVLMMLYRPEGLLPSAVRRRELHAGEAEGG